MPDPIIIMFHVSKTGGTSLLRHAAGAGLLLRVRNRLLRSVGISPRQERVYVLGSTSNRNRAAAGWPNLEEMTEEQRNAIRYLGGHGVVLDTVRQFRHRPILMMTVYRDPYARFVSVYKHRQRMKSGKGSSPEQLFEERPNPVSSNLMRRTGKDDVAEMLPLFDAILVTERLDDDTARVFSHIGLGGVTKHARVYPEQPDMGSITREMVYERDAVDLQIHRRLTEHWQASDGDPDWPMNPFRN